MRTSGFAVCSNSSGNVRFEILSIFSDSHLSLCLRQYIVTFQNGIFPNSLRISLFIEIEISFRLYESRDIDIDRLFRLNSIDYDIVHFNIVYWKYNLK